MSRSERGSVLIVVLWTCALVMWVAFLTNSDQRLRVDEEILSFDRTRGLYLAAGGVYEALARIAWQPVPSQDEEDVEDLPEGGFWRPDGRAREVVYPSGKAMVSIRPLSEMTDINAVKGDDLVKVLQSSGLTTDEAEDLAQVVEDFRDGDDERRDRGAEKREYEDMGLPYPPLNDKFISVDQLLLVPGITAEMFHTGQERNTDEEFFDQEPVEDAPLFRILTAHGGSSDYQATNETEEEYIVDIEEEEVPPTFKSGEIFRIISTGKASGRGAAVRLWVVAAKAGSSGRGYQILFRKIM